MSTSKGTAPNDVPRVVLVLSTGRCGTQWLATALDEVYGDQVVVRHEPIGPEYRCRQFFRAYDDLVEMAAVPAIRRHLDDIASVLHHRTYVETGWPLFSAIPLFVARFPGRVDVVHLTRHPVPTSISHMVHKTYGGSPRVDGYTQLAALDPFCRGVFQVDLRERWDDLSPFEKTLFWWTEVHHYAGEIRRRYPDVPMHRLRAEDMLSGDGPTLRELCRFLKVAYRPELSERAHRRVDQWHHRTDTEYDWKVVVQHPLAVLVAQQLGYDLTRVDEHALAARYKE